MSKGQVIMEISVLLKVTKLKDDTLHYINAYKKKYKLDTRDVIDHMVTELRGLKGKKEFEKCLTKKTKPEAE